MRSSPVLAAFLFMLTAAASPEQKADLEAIRDGDVRVASVGEKLAIANLPLCARTENRPGLLLHDIRQYSGDLQDAARAVFGFPREVSVEGVVPGSPADHAGIVPNSGVVAVAGVAVDGLGAGGKGDFVRMSAILDRLETALAAGPVAVETTAGTFSLTGTPGCVSRFQIVFDGAVNAGADGQYVQIDGRMVDFVRSDGELAAVLAHELAHNILDHRRRLNAAGVDRGMFGGLGKSGALIRATEIEADRLSLYLMANAGFAPEDAIGFWDRMGAKHGYGIFSDNTHLRRKPRVEMLKQELAALQARRGKAAPGAVLIPDFARPPFAALR